MSEIRILNMNAVYKWFSDSGYYRDEFLKKCTTPLRQPDEWTQEEKHDVDKAMTDWMNGEKNFNHAPGIILEIATRPTRSAVEEMDEWFEEIGGLNSEGHKRWQKVKQEKEL